MTVSQIGINTVLFEGGMGGIDGFVLHFLGQLDDFAGMLLVH